MLWHRIKGAVQQADIGLEQEMTGRTTGQKENMEILQEAISRPGAGNAWEAPKNHGLSHRTRKNRDKAKHMSLGYVAFLLAASVMAGAILMNYVQLQSDMTKLANQVAKKESELNRLKLSNDEEYSRITNSIDLEEIRRIAIGELGMTYAKEGQIESYSSEGNDYMRRAGED